MRASVVSRRLPSASSCALDPAGRVADLLVEDQQGAAVGQLFLGTESRAADQREYRLEHRSLHCYRERCSPASG